MKEQVLAWLMATLQSVTDTAGKAIDFVAGELPLFVQEFLLFHAIWYWAAAVGALLFIIATMWFAFWVARKFHVETEGCSWFAPFVIGGLNLITLFDGFLPNLKMALMVSFAPRIFLLQEFLKFFGK